MVVDLLLGPPPPLENKLVPTFMRIWQIPNALQDFPGDDFGDDGDVAIDLLTEEIRKKVDGSWVTVATAQQSGGFLWEPSSVDAPSLVGKFAYNGPAVLAGVTSLSFLESSSQQGFDIEAAVDLVSISWPNLTTLTDTYADLIVSYCPLLTSVSLPAYTSGDGRVTIASNDSLVSISLPAFVSAFELNIKTNTALTTISLPSWSPVVFNEVDFGGNALSAATVNHILARAVASASFTSGTIILSGGTNAAPTGQGITDKAILQGRGVTVNTN